MNYVKTYEEALHLLICNYSSKDFYRAIFYKQRRQAVCIAAAGLIVSAIVGLYWKNFWIFVLTFVNFLLISLSAVTPCLRVKQRINQMWKQNTFRKYSYGEVIEFVNSCVTVYNEYQSKRRKR